MALPRLGVLLKLIIVANKDLCEENATSPNQRWIINKFQSISVIVLLERTPNPQIIILLHFAIVLRRVPFNVRNLTALLYASKYHFKAEVLTHHSSTLESNLILTLPLVVILSSVIKQYSFFIPSISVDRAKRKKTKNRFDMGAHYRIV